MKLNKQPEVGMIIRKRIKLRGKYYILELQPVAAVKRWKRKTIDGGIQNGMEKSRE